MSKSPIPILDVLSMEFAENEAGCLTLKSAFLTSGSISRRIDPVLPDEDMRTPQCVSDFADSVSGGQRVSPSITVIEYFFPNAMRMLGI